MKVTYIGHMGSDLSVVNDARVSFGKSSETLTERDERLIKFLARGLKGSDWNGLVDKVCEVNDRREAEDLINVIRRIPKHWAPFANGGTIKMRFKVPIFVIRQLHKHSAGFESPSEISRRYVDSTPTFFEPEEWRSKAEDVKQGSGETHYNNEIYKDWVTDFHSNINDIYESIIDSGVAPEQARIILPQSMETEFIWKGNLYS